MYRGCMDYGGSLPIGGSCLVGFLGFAARSLRFEDFSLVCVVRCFGGLGVQGSNPRCLCSIRRCGWV